MGASETGPETFSLNVTIGIELEPTLVWVPPPTVGLHIMMIGGEGGLKLDEEPEEPREDSVWGLEGL